jgi:hypothetical protein
MLQNIVAGRHKPHQLLKRVLNGRAVRVDELALSVPEEGVTKTHWGKVMAYWMVRLLLPTPM